MLTVLDSTVKHLNTNSNGKTQRFTYLKCHLSPPYSPYMPTLLLLLVVFFILIVNSDQSIALLSGSLGASILLSPCRVIAL